MDKKTKTTARTENEDKFGPAERRKAVAQILARGIRRLLEGCAAVPDEEEACNAAQLREGTKMPVSSRASSLDSCAYQSRDVDRIDRIAVGESEV